MSTQPESGSVTAERSQRRRAWMSVTWSIVLGAVILIMMVAADGTSSPGGTVTVLVVYDASAKPVSCFMDGHDDRIVPPLQEYAELRFADGINYTTNRPYASVRFETSSGPAVRAQAFAYLGLTETQCRVLHDANIAGTPAATNKPDPPWPPPFVPNRDPLRDLPPDAQGL